jgi:hypothetical protein
MISSSLYKYYRSLNIKINSDIIVDQLGSRMIFIATTDHSFYIYDLEKLNILFIGPYIEKITKSYFYRDVLYISSDTNLMMYKRGALINTIDFKQNIKDIQGLDDVLFILLDNNRLTIYENNITMNDEGVSDCKIEMINEINDVSMMWHPKTYINKILIQKDDKFLMFNFIKNKIIYEFKSIDIDLLKIKNTRVVDIVGIIYENRLDIVNLKQDKILYTLELRENGGFFVNLDFCDDKLMYVQHNTLFLYDLVNKYKILHKSGILNAQFIDETYILVTTPSEISIYEINNGKLDMIKNKIMNISGINNMEFINNKNFVLVNGNSVVRYSLVNDINSNKIIINKDDYDIEPIKSSCYKDNIVVYKKNMLWKIDLVNNRSTFLLRNEIKDFSLYKERILFVTEKYNIMNINSKLVHYKMEKIFDNVIYHGDYVISYNANMINIFNYINKKQYNLNANEIVKIRVVDNFVCVQTKFNLLFYNFDESECFRIYNIQNIIDFDINNKILCVLDKKHIYIYDILSNIEIDKMNLLHECKFIRFSSDSFFIVVVSNEDEVLILSKKVYKIENNSDENILNDNMINLEISEQSNNVRWNINELFNITYKDLDLHNILEDILNNLDKDYLKYNTILNKVIKKYYKSFNKDLLGKFYEKYKEISKKYMDEYIRCTKYY